MPILKLGRRKRGILLKLSTKGRINNIQPDNLAFFPEIGVLFNRIKKSGNTTIALFFHSISGARIGPDVDVEELKNERSLRHTSLASIATAQRYTSFVCVRNPYHRAISTFVEKVGRANDTRFTNFPGYGDISQGGFENYLSYLTDLDMSEINQHFWSQSDLLCQKPEFFDCIARLESLPDDMAGFLSELGLDPDEAKTLRTPHPLEASQPGKITNASSRTDMLSAAACRMIEDIYTEDFENFGY